MSEKTGNPLTKALSDIASLKPSQPRGPSELFAPAGSAPSAGYAPPQPLFSCSQEGCREEVSYPANMLHWYEPQQRWVCENCWENLPWVDDGENIPPIGISLEAWLLREDFSVARLLHNATGEARADNASLPQDQAL